MKILIISPLQLPYTVGSRYTGIERLAAQFSQQFEKLGHDVSLIAHPDTNTPNNVSLYPSLHYDYEDAEVSTFKRYHHLIHDFDAVLDFSHLHLAGRQMVNKPIVSIFWHDPSKIQYPKAPYNIVSISQWGTRMFKRYYHQDARYQETIMIDPDVYKPDGKRGDRFLTIGRMSREKGNLNAVDFCKELNLPLDVAGGRGAEKNAPDVLTDYEQEVMASCDGKQIVFHGEVSEEKKVELMQSCKALLYITDHAEVYSHKIQEAMLSGAPVIVPDLGGLSEIVNHGVDGFLCNTSEEYKHGVEHLNALTPTLTRPALANKHHPQNVAEGYIGLLSEVANGLRW